MEHMIPSGGSDYAVIIVAVIIAIGNVLAVLIQGIVSARNTKRAQKDATDAQIAVQRAEEQSEIAKRAQAESTRQLIAEVRQAGAKVQGVGRVAEEVRAMTQETRGLVSQRVNGRFLNLLRERMLFAERVARENPGNATDQELARKARDDFECQLDSGRSEE